MSSTQPIADLSSGTPIPHSTPPSSSLPSKPILLSPKSLDTFLSHLHRCLSTPSGIDTVLLFLCYTSRLSSSLLTALSTRALHRSAADWIALISASRGTTVLLSPTATKRPLTAAATLLLAQRLKNLSGLLSEARTILRLWGLLGMYFWAKRLVSQTLSSFRPKSSSEKDGAAGGPTALELGISYAQLATCVVFQALENGAYLSSKGVLGWSPAKQAWAGKWSARFWGLYVGIELGKLAAERVAGGRRDEVGAARWRSAFVRNLAWAPLTVHWGSDKGVVSDWMVGALASVPGIIQMGELWRETA
jgi:hypothetical protein